MAVDIFAGAPDPSQDDRTPGPYQVWAVEVAFTADRGGDAWGARKVRLTFDRIDAGTPEHEALMTLWRLHDERVLAHYRQTGAGSAFM